MISTKLVRRYIFKHGDRSLTSMGFVHQPKDNPFLVLIFISQLTPDTCKLFVRRAPLTNDIVPSAPTSVVMNVDNTETSGIQASLDQFIVQSNSVVSKLSTKLVVNEELPRYRKPINIQTMRSGEMFHLAYSIGIVFKFIDPRVLPLSR